MRALWLTIGIALAPAGAVAEPATYFCPWADTVVRISLDGAAVDLEYAIYTGTKEFLAQTISHPFQEDRTAEWFRATDGKYTYDFYLDPDFADLWSVRRPTAGGNPIWQRGYCFTVE